MYKWVDIFMTFACMSEAIRLHPTFLSVYLFYRYKIHDILFSNHGPLKGIKGTCTNTQRKNHNYMSTATQWHIYHNILKVINNNHVVFVARLLSLK